ncbi:MAG: hypothetical protein ABIH41_00080 [Nanoarchaeota archaeon]
MNFERPTDSRTAMIIGYAAAYVIFTGMLYLLLNLLHKLPDGWKLWHIAAITILIAGSGFLLERWLK